MTETLQTAADLSKIGHLLKIEYISPKSGGNLHRGDIIDLPKVLGIGHRFIYKPS
jgi:hypothetical protein